MGRLRRGIVFSPLACILNTHFWFISFLGGARSFCGNVHVAFDLRGPAVCIRPEFFFDVRRATSQSCRLRECFLPENHLLPCVSELFVFPVLDVPTRAPGRFLRSLGSGHFHLLETVAVPILFMTARDPNVVTLFLVSTLCFF